LTYFGPSLAELHADYAKLGRIDERAPIAAREETTVDASAAVVWQKLSDVRAWASNLEPGVRRISVPDGVRVDARFSRTAGGARMRARFAVVDVERELAWTGSAFGIKVAHRFTLEPLSGTRTRIVVEESMAGPPLAALFNTGKLGALLRDSLRTLKAAAEGATR
jgi:polyketide cyclase/dehydrase/lipid transport protein